MPLFQNVWFVCILCYICTKAPKSKRNSLITFFVFSMLTLFTKLGIQQWVTKRCLSESLSDMSVWLESIQCSYRTYTTYTKLLKFKHSTPGRPAVSWCSDQRTPSTRGLLGNRTGTDPETTKTSFKSHGYLPCCNSV